MSEKVEPKSAPKPCAPPPAALLEGGMAEAVIGGALLGVLEDLVGLVDFLEVVLAVLVAGIAIGMPLHRQLAEGGLELAVARGALDLENFVVAALGHHRIPPVMHVAASSPDLMPAVTHDSFKNRCTPGSEPGGASCLRSTVTALPAPPPRSGRLLVLLVVVDLGEFRVDDVLLLAGSPPAAPPAVRPAGSPSC